MIRRTFICATVAVAATSQPIAFAETKIGIRPESVPGSQQYPQLRAGTQLDHLYESLLANGFGIKNPDAKSGQPTVVIVSDTQCPWCSKLWNDTKPLWDEINFIWYPVPLLKDLSISQAALILSSRQPWKMLEEHEEHFKDKNFRGINPKGAKVSQEYRDEVWTNAKIARWSGLTTVPLGVFKNKEGAYIPIFSGTSTKEIKKIVLGE